MAILGRPVSRSRPDDDLNVDRVPRPFASRAGELPDGHVVERHRHRRAQLLFASQGVMAVETDQGIWIVPPQRAVWVPPGVDHEVSARGRLSMRSIYFAPEIVVGMPATCTVVPVTSLLRELILAAVSFEPEYPFGGPEERLLNVLLDQIQALPVMPLHLPIPADRRLKPIAEALAENPADRRSLEEWAETIGASTRTLSRLFTSETGMTFSEWRQQVRLLSALDRLAAGEAVKAVALDLGYDSQSAFITMFRKALGTTPGKYFSEAETHPLPA